MSLVSAAGLPARAYLHADDYGASKGVTDAILECHDHGHLNSLSILANGVAFDYAIAELRKRPGIRLSVHLNLTEREPVLPPGEVPDLVNAQGQFARGFVGLWLTYLRSGSRRRRALRDQIRRELASQIRKVRDAAGIDGGVHVDGHYHVHMVPFVFDEVLALARDKNLDIEYVRVPREPWFFALERAQSIYWYLGPNTLKHVLLNALSRRHRRRMRATGLSTCEHFVGVQCVGGMTPVNVAAAVRRFGRPLPPDTPIEVLFHPGGTGEAEEWSIWSDPIERRFYSSPLRRAEAEAMKDGELVRVVAGAYEP